MDIRYLHKFYKKNYKEKLQALEDANAISLEDFNNLKNNLLRLPPNIANEMIENYLVNYELPFGIGMNFLINDQELLIPMVTEEPSVIAAASNSAKIIGNSGGFQTEMVERLVIGQIAFSEISNSQKASMKIKAKEAEILNIANESYPSILNYSEGARRIEVRILPANEEYNTPEFLVVHLLVDTGEAMGANIVNTMSEAVAVYISELIDGSNLMNILSNYARDSIATARCSIEPQYLATNTLDGEIVRDKIIAANQLALVDPYRATTHNKGIMNGIGSLVIATGNDWRAVEAGAHTYAVKDGQYRSLTMWTKDQDGNLKGEISLPILVGSVGGTLSIHPTAQFAYRLLGEPNTRELSQILAAVGLGQNLAAVRALVTEGIQKGHMSLQARALAIRIGAKDKNIDLLAKGLQESKHMNSETAKTILKEILNKQQET